MSGQSRYIIESLQTLFDAAAFHFIWNCEYLEQHCPSFSSISYSWQLINFSNFASPMSQSLMQHSQMLSARHTFTHCTILALVYTSDWQNESIRWVHHTVRLCKQIQWHHYWHTSMSGQCCLCSKPDKVWELHGPGSLQQCVLDCFY